jgi:hypothetical protein
MVELAFSGTDMLTAQPTGCRRAHSSIGCDPISSSGRMHAATSGMLVRTATLSLEDPRDEPHETAWAHPTASGMLAGRTARRFASGMLDHIGRGAIAAPLERSGVGLSGHVRGRTQRRGATFLRVSTNESYRGSGEASPQQERTVGIATRRARSGAEGRGPFQRTLAATARPRH